MAARPWVLPKELKEYSDNPAVKNRAPAKLAVDISRAAILSRIDHMEKIDKPVTTRKLTAEFDSGGYASKEIISLDSVRKSYGAKIILNDFSLKLYRNNRIALVGANGCGKSTLLKMITGEEHSDSGEIKLNVSVKPAYMPQIITFDNMDATVLDTLRSETGETEGKARNILAGFHFGTDDIMKKVSSLSGGEKSRLKLCLMMQNNVNFLLLDEPTNHLDIASRKWIENALADFEGTVLFVSHDRYFLNKFANNIWSMDDGIITEYDCGFDEYLEMTRLAVIQKEKNARKSPASKAKTQKHTDKTVSAEDLIHEAEAELKKVNEAMNSDLFASDAVKMNMLYEEKNQLEERIAFLYNEWLND